MAQCWPDFTTGVSPGMHWAIVDATAFTSRENKSLCKIANVSKQGGLLLHSNHQPSSSFWSDPERTEVRFLSGHWAQYCSPTIKMSFAMGITGWRKKILWHFTFLPTLLLRVIIFFTRTFPSLKTQGLQEPAILYLFCFNSNLESKHTFPQSEKMCPSLLGFAGWLLLAIRLERFPKGEDLHGQSQHKQRSITCCTKVFILEDKNQQTSAW